MVGGEAAAGSWLTCTEVTDHRIRNVIVVRNTETDELREVVVRPETVHHGILVDETERGVGQQGEGVQAEGSCRSEDF